MAGVVVDQSLDCDYCGGDQKYFAANYLDDGGVDVPGAWPGDVAEAVTAIFNKLGCALDSVKRWRHAEPATRWW